MWLASFSHCLLTIFNLSIYPITLKSKVTSCYYCNVFSFIIQASGLTFMQVFTLFQFFIYVRKTLHLFLIKYFTHLETILLWTFPEEGKNYVHRYYWIFLPMIRDYFFLVLFYLLLPQYLVDCKLSKCLERAVRLNFLYRYSFITFVQ